MLFDRNPKEKEEDMFNRVEEISILKGNIEKKISLNVITGFRRIGKTSLLQTVLNPIEDKIIIDLRALAPKDSIAKSEIIGKFQTTINSFLSENADMKSALKDAILRITGVSVLGTGIQFASSKEIQVDLAGVLDELDNWAKAREKPIVLALDEAQHFNKVKDFNMAEILAHIYDYCKNIVVILTGSEIGLLYNFLGKTRSNDARTKFQSKKFSDHALAGRAIDEIPLQRFSSEQSKEFLREGFKQLGEGYENEKDFDNIIEKAVDKLGGIVGWLILFGINCQPKDKFSENIIPDVQKEGADMAYGEFVHFLEKSKSAKRHENIVKMLSKGEMSWTNIKKELGDIEGTVIYDANVSNLIETLVDYGFIDFDSENKIYSVPDPLLAHHYN